MFSPVNTDTGSGVAVNDGRARGRERWEMRVSGMTE